MSQDETAAGTPKPEAPAPAPGNLWSEFLRRNLLLAGLAGTAAARAAKAEHSAEINDDEA